MKWSANKSFIPYLMDPELKIPDAHLVKVCKRSSGPLSCRYIVQSIIGHICVKNTPIRSAIDLKVDDKWLAKGNNCDGFINAKTPKKAKKDKENQKK